MNKLIVMFIIIFTVAVNFDSLAQKSKIENRKEMKAKAQEARAAVILAEAEIPKAIAEAFKTGNLGIMDYYKFQNIQADTRMRDSISDPNQGVTGQTRNPGE